MSDEEARGLHVVVTIDITRTGEVEANVKTSLEATGEEWMVDAIHQASEEGRISVGFEALTLAICQALGDVATRRLVSRSVTRAGRVGRA